MLTRGAPPPAHTWRAPGRVTVIGDHTDYQDGLCLALAIDRDCRVTVVPADGTQVRATSAQAPGTVEVQIDGSTEPASVEPRWGSFVAGAVAACVARGIDIGPCDVTISSTVPLGVGLSSSSALSVALVLAFTDCARSSLDRRDLAALALDAEVRATAVPGGLLDQMTALHAVSGHVLLLDCRTLSVDPIALPRSLGFVVVHSGRTRALAESEYAARRAAVEASAKRLGLATLRDARPEQVRGDARARHVVSENCRVQVFADALRDGRTRELGPLMLASHASLRDDYSVSTPELDHIVELLMARGALGARVTGAGFGGCVVGLVQRNHADDLLAKVTRDMASAAHATPLPFAVRPAAAAGAVTSDRAARPSSPRTPRP